MGWMGSYRNRNNSAAFHIEKGVSVFGQRGVEVVGYAFGWFRLVRQWRHCDSFAIHSFIHPFIHRFYDCETNLPVATELWPITAGVV